MYAAAEILGWDVFIKGGPNQDSNATLVGIVLPEYSRRISVNYNEKEDNSCPCGGGCGNNC